MGQHEALTDGKFQLADLARLNKTRDIFALPLRRAGKVVPDLSIIVIYFLQRVAIAALDGDEERIDNLFY